MIDMFPNVQNINVLTMAIFGGRRSVYIEGSETDAGKGRKYKLDERHKHLVILNYLHYE